MKKTFLILSILAASLIHAPVMADEKSDLLSAELMNTFQLRKDGVLTFTQAAIEAKSLVSSYYPQDSLLASYYTSLIAYSEAYDAGRIDKDKFNELAKVRWDGYLKAKEQRTAEITAEQQAEQDRSALNAALGAASNALRSPGKVCSYVSSGKVVTQPCY